MTRANSLSNLVQYSGTMKLAFLSATPMYNNYTEIVWLLNILNRNDKREAVDIRDIFEPNGSFKTDPTGAEIGKELFMRKATGYISFVNVHMTITAYNANKFMEVVNKSAKLYGNSFTYTLIESKDIS